MTVPPNGAIALIIGDDQNNIRLLGLGGGLEKKTAKDKQEYSERSQSGLHWDLIKQKSPFANRQTGLLKDLNSY